MRYNLITITALAGSTYAFPAAVLEAMGKMPLGSNEKRQTLGIDVGFDPVAQAISNSGANAFVAPGPTDLRGPCPGLNALANHNYLPHDGVATITEFIEATNAVFGMGVDLATFLSVYGAALDGDLVSWSIGGPPPASLLSPLSGFVGTPQGISGSHNKYETDASPTRGDLYTAGNDYLLQIEQFNDLYSYQADETEETSNYDLGVLGAFRARRFNESISTNPYFFNGPFAGVSVQAAAYTFIYRFMANHSSEFPEGRLSQNVLKSFFSITGEPGSFQYTPGQEAIPSNWYRRAIGDEYGLNFFSLDMVTLALQYPQFLSIGGNTGTVNTFTGVDIANLTGGVYDLTTLSQGNNAQCYTYQILVQMLPDVLEGLYEDTTSVLDSVISRFNSASSGLNCPQLETIQMSQFNGYPGYSKTTANGQY